MALELSIHGAARTVTGSCLEFRSGNARVLVDCGLFQGSRTLEELNFRPLPFDVRQIDAVILTHAHIDHSGLLPRLAAEGYRGPIFCTRETADLLEFMLADAGRIHEAEAERRNRRRERAGVAPVAPIYTEKDARDAWRLARPLDLEAWFEPAPGFRARLWNAGHILGSASVELEGGGARVMCSGDLGPDNKAFHPMPAGPADFDHVICESTYGNRRREPVTIAERRTQLEAEINAARTRGGNLIIPVFALERTQELLLDIAHLLRERRIGSAQVFVDSPLANKVTGVFARYVRELEDTAGSDIFDDPAIRYVNDVADSMRLNTLSGGIILAASGMCEAGRIRHHLVHNLHRRDSTVLFVGFQAQGSLGRVISDGAQHVRISGRDIAVRAQIRRIDSYSAHADQEELLNWVAARAPISGSLFFDHGETDAIEELRRLAQARELASSLIVPGIGESYQLPSGAPAKRTRTGSDEIAHALGRDWQNDYADLTTNLKRKLEAIRSKEARERALQQMQRILDSCGPLEKGRRQSDK